MNSNNKSNDFPEVYSTETRDLVIEMTNSDGSVTESRFSNPNGTLTVTDIQFGDRSGMAALIDAAQNQVLDQIRIKIKDGAVATSKP